MERILVAVDFSEASRIAFCSALKLSQAWNAPLHVVHVLPHLVFGPEYAQMVSLLGPGPEEMERELMDFVLTELKGSDDDLERIDQKVLEGSESGEILREAERWKATLVVVGSRGKNPMERVFMGSVSSKVVSRAPVPVLVVREKELSLPCRVLAAIDEGATARTVLRTTARWVKTLESSFEVLHVMPELPDRGLAGLSAATDLRSNVRTLLEHIRKDVEGVVQEEFPGEKRPSVAYRVGTPSVEICGHAAEGGFDVVIVGAHEAHGILDLGNTASRVAQRGPCSVMIARTVEPRVED